MLGGSGTIHASLQVDSPFTRPRVVCGAPMRLRPLGSRLSLLLAWTTLGFIYTTRADAQTLPSLDTRTWRPPTDPGASLVLEPVTAPGAGEWNVGAWLNYANRPVTLRQAGTDEVLFRPVEHMLGADLTGAIGLGARASFGLDVPVLLYQDGTSPLPSTVSSTGHTTTSGIGDIGFTGKALLVGNESGGFGLAALAAVTLPTGDRTSFMGAGSTTVGARLLADYSLVFADLQASLGYTLLTDHHTWPDPSVGGLTFGDQIPWTIGLRLHPGVFKLDSSNRQTWELAVHGWLPAGPVLPFGGGDPGSAAESPVLLAASERVALGHYRDAFALAGLDVGLSTAVGVPTVRGVVAVGWAPRAHDMDHDGVPDDVDQCPEIAEDIDGFEDSDGCPDIDDDDDGIIDSEDACPRVPGVASPDPKKNGCPSGDTDGDGIPDAMDACPKEKGPASEDPKLNGCPRRDRDGDGITDDVDRCPDQPEDKDGFQDEDGCPDPDNDGDGIADPADACPNVAGEPSTDPRRNGCPNPDRDGDTYENDADSCPDAAEVFNGIKDDDGCPDEGGAPLVMIDTKNPRLPIRLAAPLKLGGTADAPEIDKGSVMTLRALALELNRHRDWTLAAGARPSAAGEAAATQATNRAFAVVHTLTLFTHRDGASETVGWDAVKQQPSGVTGLGMMILVAPVPPSTPAIPPRAPPAVASPPPPPNPTPPQR